MSKKYNSLLVRRLEEGRVTKHYSLGDIYHFESFLNCTMTKACCWDRFIHVSRSPRDALHSRPLTQCTVWVKKVASLPLKLALYVVTMLTRLFVSDPLATTT